MVSANCGFDGDHFSHQVLVHSGPTILVNIGLDSAHDRNSGVPPIADISDVPALIDTGARYCCIDDVLAYQLNLPIRDRQLAIGVNDSREANLHLAQVYVPRLNFLIDGLFAALPLAQRFEQKVILGRSFLRYFQLDYEGPTGRVIIRTPENLGSQAAKAQLGFTERTEQ